MDPQARINALKQYMDFYRQNMHPAQTYSSPGSFGYGMSQPVNDDAAMAFAQQQLGREDQQMPDFFNSKQPSYTPPSYTPPTSMPQTIQSIAAGAGFPLAPADRPVTTGPRPEVTQLGMGVNFLRNLFR